MKSTISICLMASLMMIFTGCKKESAIQSTAPNQDSQLKQTAVNTLKSQMTTESFADLDLANTKEMNLDGAPALMIIPSKTNTNKSLYFGDLKNTITANWVEHQGKVKNGKLISETIILSDLQNNQLNKLVVKDNHLISSGTALSKSTLAVTKKNLDLGDGFNDPADLGEVVVTGYIPASNSYLEMYGLYWLTNFNPIYSNLYSLDPNYNFTNDGSSSELIYHDFERCDYLTHVTNGVVTNLGNGKLQLTSEAPAFIFSGLDIKFNYEPSTSTFDMNSFSSKPTGYVFIGGWELSKIEDIIYENGLISFRYTYLNTAPGGGYLRGTYKMNILYDTNTHLVYWTWIK